MVIKMKTIAIRFCIILTLWRKFKNLRQLLRAYFVFGNFCMLLGKVSMVQMAKYEENNQAIWSHCRKRIHQNPQYQLLRQKFYNINPMD